MPALISHQFCTKEGNLTNFKCISVRSEKCCSNCINQHSTKFPEFEGILSFNYIVLHYLKGKSNSMVVCKQTQMHRSVIQACKHMCDFSGL